MRLQAVKGTADRLPEDQARWRNLQAAVVRVLERAGAVELTPPIFEFAELFERSVGESADLVVQKEMYSFEDRGGRRLTLRPELTAGVMRAFVEHGMHTRPSPQKLYSIGPAFRAENVQRGRFRQFHQVNFEIIGVASPVADAEAISLLVDILHEAGLRELTVALGTVGDPDDRLRYNAYLREQLAPRADELTETSQERLRLNPMRLLDAKDPGDRAIIEPLARPIDFLNPDAKAHFEQVQACLLAWGVPFEVDPAIVRGLDYYRRTAFEVNHGGIGAQSALCGGGRYDGLIAELGGPDVPGIGWAFGMERVLDAMAQEGVTQAQAEGPLLYLVPMDEQAVAEVAGLARRLRGRARVEHGYSKRQPGKGLRDADRAGAVYAALIGERERLAGTVQLKHLSSGEERSVAQDELASALGLDAKTAATTNLGN